MNNKSTFLPHVVPQGEPVGGVNGKPASSNACCCDDDHFGRPWIRRRFTVITSVIATSLLSCAVTQCSRTFAGRSESVFCCSTDMLEALTTMKTNYPPLQTLFMAASSQHVHSCAIRVSLNTMTCLTSIIRCTRDCNFAMLVTQRARHS